jgi:hypothetical protein
MSDNVIYLNGINGMTGEYLVPPMPLDEAAALARGKPKDNWVSGWLGRIQDVIKRPFMGLPLDVDPTDVSRAGWGVVFPENISAEIRDAVQPLIAHRRKRVPPDRCKELEYTSGVSMRDWLKNYNVDTGNVKPKKVPYYLLLIGDPTAIPYEFQYLLDIEYAVGRLAFDTPEQYRQYAESVVAYETAGAVPNGRELVYWATRHASDAATQMSADHLITPLYEGIPDSDEEDPIAEMCDYRQRCLKKKDAKKANLLDILTSTGTPPPAMLVTASHGMGWPIEEKEKQRLEQGALLCQDWLGFGSVKPNHYLAGAEIPDDARVHGMVAFLFACFGVGTPQYDNFLKDRSRGPVQLADQPFVAALPQRLLSHPQGSALAVLGHIERAWGYSIVPDDKVGSQILPFRNCIGRILAGEPVGHSTKDFSEKYATLSTDLLSKLDETKPEERPSDEELAWTWIERNDAQNYIMLGDPAVQLRVDLLE